MIRSVPMLSSFDFNSARTEEPSGSANPKGMLRLPVALHPPMPVLCLASPTSGDNSLPSLSFFCTHVVNESWGVARAVTAVVEYCEDTKIGLEVDLCHVFVVLEMVRTSEIRVTHIIVKTEETQTLRIVFVLVCAT